MTFQNCLQGVQIFCHSSQVLECCRLSAIKAARRFALDFCETLAQEVMSLSQKTHRDKTAGELHGTILIPPMIMIHLLQINKQRKRYKDGSKSGITEYDYAHTVILHLHSEENNQI